jgi:quercetin dioxygenase-like cupin family protein
MNTSLTVLVPKIIRSGDGDCLELKGEVRHQLLDGNQTGGNMAFAHARFVHGSGSPLHVQTREEEFFFIERGEFTFQLGNESHRVGPGDFVFGPRLIPHGYKCISDEGGALYVGVMEAGFENFFREMAVRLADIETFGPPQMYDLAETYGVRFDGFDSLPDVPVTRAKVIPAGGGECIEVFGDTASMLVDSTEVENRFCIRIIETPSLGGPPLHVQEYQNQMFLIRAGRYEFQIGDARVRVEAGDVVFIPRGMPHTYRVVSAESGCLLAVSVPGRNESYVTNPL